MQQDTHRPHVVITGHGRSGTNMVLDLYDRHPGTFCRNEPNELVGTAFQDLGDPMDPATLPDDFDTRWQHAIEQTARRAGARDRFRTDKAFFRDPVRAKLGQAVSRSRRLRGLVAPRHAGQGAEEWALPRFHVDPVAQAAALPVMKILLAPAWINRAHQSHPGQHVVHVIRRPEDFLQSWYARYVMGVGGGPDKVLADNQPSLHRIRAHFGRSAVTSSGDLARDLVVSELWRWRYLNETLCAALDGDARYLRAPYDAVMADQAGWAARLFDFAGLTFPPNLRAEIASMTNTLFKPRGDGALPADLIADALDEVMAESPWRAVLLNGAQDA